MLRVCSHIYENIDTQTHQPLCYQDLQSNDSGSVHVARIKKGEAGAGPLWL